MSDQKPEIDFNDFLKLDIRVGTITDVADFPEARHPAYKLTIDFGPDIGTRRSSAQVTEHYTKAELLGRQVAAVVNFPPKQIGPMRSECLVVGFPDSRGRVVLATPDRPIPNGGQLY